MLGDIDYLKKIQLPQLFLCRPNGQTIAKLHEAFSIRLKLKLGNIDELEFLVPYELELQHLIQDNPNIPLLRDRYLIRFVYGDMTEWFLIDTASINIEDEKNYKDVKCYSLAYELRDKLLHNYKTQTLASDGTYIDTSYNASKLLNDALSDTIWNIGYVDASFDTIYRSFSETSITALDFILKIGETFQGILKFDTEKREVSLYSMNSAGLNRGLTFSYGHYVKTMKKEIQKEDLCTRLKVYGKDGVSIDAANPTGSEYLEDFSYFLYPYQEDESGNILQESYYMSSELCHAILQYNKKVQSLSGQYSSLLSQLTVAQTQLTSDQNIMTGFQTQLKELQDNLDTANAINNVGVGNWDAKINYVTNNVVTYSGVYYKAIANNVNVMPSTPNNTVWVSSNGTSNLTINAEINALNTQIASQQTAINSDDTNISNIMSQIQMLQISLAIENNFTPLQIIERNKFVIEKEFSDTNVDTAQDLYNAALLAFEKLKTPSPLITIDIVNFKEIVECQHDWDKLNLGDTVTIYYPQFDTNVQALIVEADFNFDEDGGTSSSDSQCQITISNFKNVLTDEQRLLSLLYKSSGTSSTVDMGKYKWDSTVANVSEVQQILQNTWDANFRAITAGINESVRIDNRGITITDPNDPMSYLVAQHGILAITSDGGQSWKNAITTSGIIGERIIGEIIMGENLKITSNDGVLQFIGNQGVIYDRNESIVMKLGLYDTISGVDKFGVELFGQNGHVLMDSNDGFSIVGKDGQNRLWMDTDGNVHATNAYFNGVVDATAFSINGVNFLTSDGLYLDGAHIKHVVADTIDTGTLNAHVVDVKSQLADGGEIIIDGAGFRAIDKDGNTTVNIGSNGGQIVGAEIDSAPDGNARIQLKGNTFTGLTANDLASGLKFIVNNDGSSDIGMYHQGTKMINFYDGITFFTIEPTLDADFLGLGATSHETRCYGQWNFYDTTITMIDKSGFEKFSITTVPSSTGTSSNPIITMGVGTGTGDNGKVKITKLDDGVDISYTDSSGNVKKFTANDAGIGVNHSIGSYIQLDNSGNVTIHATNNMNLSHGGTLNLDA